MRAVLTVFAKEFRENLRERRTLISALLFGPLLGAAAVRRRAVAEPASAARSRATRP